MVVARSYVHDIDIYMFSAIIIPANVAGILIFPALSCNNNNKLWRPCPHRRRLADYCLHRKPDNYTGALLWYSAILNPCNLFEPAEK